jgi:hypothetical protein
VEGEKVMKLTLRVSGQKGSLGELAARYLKYQRVAKSFYKKADAVLSEILTSGPGFPFAREIILPNGSTVKLVDNFADKNVVFRPAAVKRFEIVEV